MKRFENKIVLVTGAGRGIGASIAKRFASEGAEVIVNYSGNDEAAQKTVDEITATGGQAQKYTVYFFAKCKNFSRSTWVC